MTEIWKDIEGYEGLYKISNLGNVLACEKYAKVRGGAYRKINPRLLNPYKCINGYIQINLRKDKKSKPFLIHRLVAKAFIENPNNYSEVNHKDEDITNNIVDNLEWCTHKYNANYGTRNQRMLAHRKNRLRPVNQYSKDGKFIKHWESMSEVEKELGADTGSIIRVCKGLQHTCIGYVWEYAQKKG